MQLFISIFRNVSFFPRKFRFYVSRVIFQSRLRKICCLISVQECRSNVYLVRMVNILLIARRDCSSFSYVFARGSATRSFGATARKIDCVRSRSFLSPFFRYSRSAQPLSLSLSQEELVKW